MAERDFVGFLAAHRQPTATLRRERPIAFGISYPDRVSDLIHRAQAAISSSKIQQQKLGKFEEVLHKQEQDLPHGAPLTVFP